MVKKSKLQQERAVITAGNHGLEAKTVTSGETAQHIPAASASGAGPRHDGDGGASNSLRPPFR